MRYFIHLSYDGTEFFGWQSQSNQISVQETVESVLSKLHSNEPIKVVGCGRTDSGVHAKHYTLHVDLPHLNSKEDLLFKLNRMLPSSIAIHSIEEVDPEKHARFDAKWRTYRYFIHLEKDPFKVKHSTYFPNQLNFEAMNDAANFLIGIHDFTTFSKVNTEVKTHLCEVRKANWVKVSETDYYFDYTANRFLRNMVRATVGTLFDVGTGKISLIEFEQILNSQDRSKASGSADAEGLFLWGVEY